MTKCNTDSHIFSKHNFKKVAANFTGGAITSDGGAIALREIENRTHILKKFSECFTDYRDPEKIEHTIQELISQRIYGLALGYEDLNDHDELRHDPFLGLLVGKKDPSGKNRRNGKDRGKSLAGKSTLNRLELTPPEADKESRYKKTVYCSEKIDQLLVDQYISSYDKPQEQIILDLDATDDRIHGNQEGRFYQGYYGHYCYLPLYIFCDEHLLCSRLRPSNIDGYAGSVEEVERIVTSIRQYWPEVRIIIRGDSGFCRDDLMSWCEEHEKVDYIIGLAKNSRLKKNIEKAMEHARRRFLRTGEASRKFTNFTYRTHNSWSRKRRVVGKAEHLSKGANPRFVVTSLSRKEFDTRRLYEDEYCARGEMENHIKEQQLCLFADRTSTHKMRSNQLRLYFSSIAYTLMLAFRDTALKGTKFAKAQCDTIRNKIFKIGAFFKITHRRIQIHWSSSYPYQETMKMISRNLCCIQQE